MCGPADFDALSTCVTRLAELSAAGLTSYSIYKAVYFHKIRRARRGDPEKSEWRSVPGGLVAEGLNGKLDT